MRRLRMIAAVALLGLAAAACGQAAAATGSIAPATTEGILLTERTITVSGVGTSKAVPDLMNVSIGITLVRGSVDEANTASATRSDALIAALVGAGIDEKDLRTSNYSIYPEYDWVNDSRVLRGYRVDNTLNVTVRDLDNAGDVIDTAARTAGDDAHISGISFGFDDTNAAVDEARVEAWNDAARKAQQLAELSGQQLGTAITIVEGGVTPPAVHLTRSYAEAADAATPILAGQSDLRASVTVTFSIGN